LPVAILVASYFSVNGSSLLVLAGSLCNSQDNFRGKAEIILPQLFKLQLVLYNKDVTVYVFVLSLKFIVSNTNTGITNAGAGSIPVELSSRGPVGH
jgi:hypothetical protein